MTQPASIRLAAASDAVAIAGVHVASWRAAYQGLMPQEHLDGLSVEQHADSRRQRLLDPDITTMVAVDGAAVDGDVVGVAVAGPSRDPDGAGRGELYSLYLAPAHWSTGLGGRLHAQALEGLGARFDLATLWVLDGNTRAEAFYRRRGWVSDGVAQRSDLGGVEVDEHRLRRACRPG